MTRDPSAPFRLPPARGDEAADALADAFHDYPVMRHVLGDAPGYGARLRTLVRLFTMARVLRDEPMLGVEADGRLAAAALVSHPERTETPLALALLRERTWSELGEGPRLRYEALGAAWRTFAIAAPHLHLNMIGVRRDARGRGLGRVLLDAVEALARGTPGAEGISLTTEDPVNVALYRHCGYAVVGEHALPGDLRTWSLYRRLEPAGV